MEPHDAFDWAVANGAILTLFDRPGADVQWSAFVREWALKRDLRLRVEWVPPSSSLERWTLQITVGPAVGRRIAPVSVHTDEILAPWAVEAAGVRGTMPRKPAA